MRTLFLFLQNGKSGAALIFVLGLLLMVGAGSAAAQGGDDLPYLRMMIQGDIPCEFYSADIYQTLDESIKRFEEYQGVQVALSRAPSSGYEDLLMTALQAKSPPHVIWAEAALLPMLVRFGLVSPLENGDPGETGGDAIPADGEPEGLFTFNGELYGLALGYEGELRRNGYMRTSAAGKDGMEKAAMLLIEHLRREIPLRGLPDLAVDRVQVKEKERSRSSSGIRARQSRAVAVTAYIRNLGEATADMVEVSIEYGRQRQTEYVRNLRAGGIRKARFKVPEEDFRPTALTVTVDPFDTVSEDNEGNNILEEFFYDPPPWPGPSPFPPTPEAQGAPFIIDPAAYASDVKGMGPKVAFDGQNYLVVWARQVPLAYDGYNHELRAARIQPDGQILDPGGFVIAAGPQKYDSFEIAFDGGSIFLVVWARDRIYFDPLAAPTSVIEGVMVSTNGSVISPGPIVIENSTNPAQYNRVGHSFPDVFFDGTDFRVVYQTMVKWTSDVSDMTDAQSGIYMKRVDPLTGNATDKQTMVTFVSNVVGGDLQVAFSQGKGLLIFRGWTGTTNLTGYPAIWSRWFTLSGSLSLSVLLPVVSDSSNNDLNPFDQPVVAGVEPDFVAVWEDETVQFTPNRTALYAARGVSIPGTNAGWVVPTGPVLQACNDRYPRIAFNGTEFTVVDAHQHGCHSYLGVVNVDLDGTPGFYDYFDFGGIPDLVNQVDVAFGATEGLAVFTHFNMPSTFNGTDSSTGIWGLFLNSGSSPP